MDWSEGERWAAQRPADQPESEGKRPNALAASQRDKERESPMHSITLETGRLILRPLTVADGSAVFVWNSDPVVNRYMSYSLYTDVEQTRQWLRSVEQEPEGGYVFGFVRKSDGLLIGSGDVSPDSREPDAWGFGYNLRRDCWGQGYATEAAHAMIAFAHKELGAKIFVACHAMDNPASGRVMEKCGLTFHHDGEYSKTDGSETFPAKFYRLELP